MLSKVPLHTASARPPTLPNVPQSAQRQRGSEALRSAKLLLTILER